MIKFFIPALTIFAFATPAFADKTAPVTFSRNGETYEYTVAEKPGVKIIEGTVLTTGETFVLRVANGRVTGDVAGRDVSFPLTAIRSGDEMAAR
jgi:hypothetical protein